jgi:hypothetical protein
MFDSPLHFREKCKQYIALDQSRGGCRTTSEKSPSLSETNDPP